MLILGEEILEQIPEEFREYIDEPDLLILEKGPIIKPPNVFEYYLKEYEKREITNMIVKSTNIREFIKLFRTYREKNPKMNFISFHIRANRDDDRNQIYNISTNWLEEDIITLRTKIECFMFSKKIEKMNFYFQM